MNKQITLLAIALFFLFATMDAQELYVDVIKGHSHSKGTPTDPLASLQEAVSLANKYKGAVSIRLAPGLYLLNDVLKIESFDGDSSRYTIEAAVMPDGKDWKPWLMPVIQSVSPDNDRKYFDHCAGILAERENVCIRGIKFVGNANPAVQYYYPIEKDTTLLKNLEISQCYFIGDRNGAVVQGAIYAEGAGIHVEHCIFYGCKNAVLAFENVKNFSLSHSIIYGAYECAVWYNAINSKGAEEPFSFSDNIVSHCNYFWAATKEHDHSYYTFRNSLICENLHYVGMQNGEGGVTDLTANEAYNEINVQKSGIVKLVEVGTEGLSPGYLNPAPDSDGKNISAGIFKNK